MEYKRLIIAMITEIRKDDIIFLQQIYTIVKKHVEATGVICDKERLVK